MSIKKFNFWLKLLAFIALNLFVNQSSYAQAGFNDDRVMLQGFYWESYRHGHDKFPNFGNKRWYEIVEEQAEELREGRFDLIWLPPPSYAGQYSAGYNPKEYFRLDNSYGSFDQHRALLEALLENGVEPVADIVINHRDGSTGWAGFENPKWGTWSICRSDEAFFDERSEVCCTPEEERGAEEESPHEYTDHGGTTYQYDSFRDIDHTNEIVQCDLINYLKQLRSIGYRGWRYDMVHGFHAHRLAAYNEATQPTFSVGEYDWDKDAEQRGWVWHSATTLGDLETASSVFDFRTHFILKDNKGNYTAWYGSGDGIGKLGDNTNGHPWRNKAVTFLENHDSGYRTHEDGTPQPGHEYDNFENNWQVEQAYAYILTHPGVPTVYWKHYFDWGSDLRNKIKALINARKVARVTAGSEFYPQSNAKENGVYAAHVEGQEGALFVRIGGDDSSWEPSFSGHQDYREYAYGDGWKVWVALPGNPEVEQAPLNSAFSVPAYQAPVSCDDPPPPPPQQLTIHYYRPNGDYEDWGLHVWGGAIDNPTSWDNPLLFEEQDDCRRSIVIDIQHPGEKLGFIVHKGSQKDIDENRYVTPTSGLSAIWLVENQDMIHTTPQPSSCIPSPTQEMKIYYHRQDGNYESWGLHLWDDAIQNPTPWNNPLPFDQQDECGRFALVEVYPDETLGFIVHKGNQKDVEANRYVTPTSQLSTIWLLENDATIYTTPPPSSSCTPPPPPPPPQQLTIHYYRPNGDYEDWGLHVWGDAIDNPTDWDNPLPFEQQDDCRRSIVIDIPHPDEQLGFIVHKGSQKDIEENRYITPTSELSAIWLVENEATVHTTPQPSSCPGDPSPTTQDFTIHYHRPNGDYDGWGLHLWGDAIDNPTPWENPLSFDQQDDCSRFAVIKVHPDEKLGFIVHKGSQKDIDESRYVTPTSELSAIWLVENKDMIYTTPQPSSCIDGSSPTQELTIHYHRPNGDYDGWGLHLWDDAIQKPTTWNQPLSFTGQDDCGRFAVVEVYPDETLGFIVHKGNQKDVEANRYVTPTSQLSTIWLVENKPSVYTTQEPTNCDGSITPGIELTVQENSENKGHFILEAQTSCGTITFHANSALIKEDSLETSYSTVWDTTGLPDGTYDVTAAVSDESGQLKATSESAEIQISGGPKPFDFREETIYFLLTARFYDGDPDNNYYNRDRLKDGDPQWRGDFKGLIEKLDYIKDLGFTAIWITPPVTNRSGLDYHGYHAYDWTEVDPRLESPGATYQDLINAAHAKGLKVIQDVVINHSSNYGIRGQVWIDHLPIKYYRPEGGMPIDHGPYQGNLGNYKHPYREDNDNPLAPDWFKERQNADPEGDDPLVDPKTGETVPKPGYQPARFFNVTEAGAQELDPNWYHLDGYMKGGDWENPEALQRKHMAGDTIDLATENQDVKDYLNNAIFQYLDMGIDAIRIDTLKHMERGNVLEYVNAWKTHKPNLFVFGENLVKGTGWGDLGGDNGPSDIRPWWYTRLGNDKTNPNSGGDSGLSVLDFSLFSTFRDNLSHGYFGGIGGILGMDWVYGDATQLVTFLQNHDVGPDNDFKYRFKGEQWMAAVAYNLLWTIRGIPCLYYGEEIEFMKGAPQDIVSNDDTLDMTGRAYFGDHLSTDNLANTQNHPLYKHLQRLNLIRSNIKSLQKSPMSAVNEWGSGMSFVRDYNNGESYVVVGLAAGNDQDITVNSVRNGTYRDAVTGNTIEVTNGTLSFHVKGKSAGIYVLGGPGKIGEEGMYLK